MKRNYFFLSLLCILSVLGLKAQNPCSGTPESNTIVSVSQTICAGTSASMSLAVTYTNTGINIQWHQSTVSQVGPFAAISGATLSTYVTPNLTQTTYYMVSITCTNSNQTINVYYTIYVISCAPPCNGAPGSTSIVPASQTVCAGDVASLTLSNSYTSTGITYQWGSSGAAAGPYTAIQGATLSSFASSSLSPGAHYFSVLVTCTNSGLTYSTTTIVTAVSCTYCAGTPGSNTVMPVSHTVCAGTPASMNLAFTYTESGITYQWQSSNVSQVGPFTSVSGATLTAHTSTPLTGTTYFNVLITCTNSGKSINVPHVVTVVTCTNPCTGTPSSNTITPVNPTICVGSTAAMALANTYTNGGLTYQWNSASAQAGPYTGLPGGNTASYNTPTLGSTTFYMLVVTCTNSQQTFTMYNTVNVVPCASCSGAPAGNTIVPVTHTVCEGTSAFLSLANSYSQAGISYQWQTSTVSVAGPYNSISGATLSTFNTPVLFTNSFFGIVITCTNGGGKLSTTHLVSVVNCESTTGIAGEDLQTTSAIYPNPFNAIVTINSRREGGTFRVFDVLGNIVLSHAYGKGETQIDCRELKAGIYFVTTIENGKPKTVRMIKLTE